MRNSVHQFGDLYGDAAKAGNVPQGRTPRTGDAGGEPRVGVVYNPRSHRNKGQDLDIAALPNVTVGDGRNLIIGESSE